MIMKKLSDLFMAKTKNISKKPISKVYDMIRWIKNTVISFLHTQPGPLGRSTCSCQYQQGRGTRWNTTIHLLFPDNEP